MDLSRPEALCGKGGWQSQEWGRLFDLTRDLMHLFPEKVELDDTNGNESYNAGFKSAWSVGDTADVEGTPCPRSSVRTWVFGFSPSSVTQFE